MGNTRQAPILLHGGHNSMIEKGEQFFMIKQEIIETVFNELSGRNGNAIKLMIFLLGNSGTGTFRVSEAIVTKQTGMSPSNYRDARKVLIEKGWVKHEKGKIIVCFDNITPTEKENRQCVTVGLDSVSQKNRQCVTIENTVCNTLHNNIIQDNNNIKNNTSRSAVASLEDTNSNEEEYDWLISEGECNGNPLDVFARQI